MLRFPYVLGPWLAETNQKYSVFGHPSFQNDDSTTVFDGQNDQLRQGSHFRAKMDTAANPANPLRGLLLGTYHPPRPGAGSG